MTSEPRYRWHAAETLKQAERAAATRELGRVQQALVRALEQAAEAQRALAEHAARAPSANALCDDGSARALDLQRAADFARRHADAARALRAELERAHGNVSAAQAAVLAQQAALGSAHAGERVLERDRERFERAERTRTEHAEQIEIEEGLGTRGGQGRKPT